MRNLQNLGKHFFATIGCLVFVVNFGCVQFNKNEANRCEIREGVMSNGMTIIAQTEPGDLEIKAGQGGKRSFTWDGKTVEVELIPRCERWYGALGLLSPNHIRPPHQNVVILNMDEYQVHFKTFDDFLDWKTKYSSSDDIYRDDGLNVRFLKRTNNEGLIAIDIHVGQLLINGEKPNSLSGSQNHRIWSSNTVNP